MFRSLLSLLCLCFPLSISNLAVAKSPATLHVVREHPHSLLVGESLARLVEIEEDLWAESLQERVIFTLDRAVAKDVFIFLSNDKIQGYFLYLTAPAVLAKGACSYFDEQRRYLGRDCVYGHVATEILLNSALEQQEARRAIFIPDLSD